MNDVLNWIETALPKLKLLVADERRIGVEILELLAECERRKAYAELGCDGLFSFCVRVLGFTEAQSFQRIQAMRAMRLVPELKSKIESGVMSVSTVAQVQGVIRKERAQGISRSALERRELFARFENKTSQEVKKEIALVMGQRIRLRLTLEMDEEAEALWRQVKEQSAHQTGGDELSMMKMLMRQWIGVRGDRVRVGTSNSCTVSESENNLGLGNKTTQESSNTQAREFAHNAKNQKNNAMITDTRRDISWLTQVPSSIDQHPKIRLRVPRKIPISLQREVFRRDQGKCKNCGSRYALQIDHIVPFANVGMHELGNLRLLCRNCNLSHGVKQFGLTKMGR